MTEAYPKRPKFWSNHVNRLMHKSCAATEMGIESCWLVSVIVHVEDAKRYSGAVTFYNNQLLPVTGFESWGRLDRARKRAVDAGWLHYEAGLNRKAGRYWATIPEEVQASFDDSPVADDIPQEGFEGDISTLSKMESETQNVSTMERQTGSKRGPNGDRSAEPFIPNPNPIPEDTCVRGTQAAAASGRQAYPRHFEAVWQAYPKQRRRDKRGTFKAYMNAVARRVQSSGESDRKAQAFLLERVTSFSASFKGQNYSPAPKRWFDDDCWEQAVEDWADFDSDNDAATEGREVFDHVVTTVKANYSPDVGPSSLTGKLDPVELDVVRSVGLDAIASWHPSDSALVKRFTRELESAR